MDFRDPIIGNIAAIIGIIVTLFVAVFAVWPEFRTAIISAIRNHKWLSILGVILIVVLLGAALVNIINSPETAGRESFSQNDALQRLYNDETLNFDADGLAKTSDGQEIRKIFG